MERYIKINFYIISYIPIYLVEIEVISSVSYRNEKVEVNVADGTRHLKLSLGEYELTSSTSNSHLASLNVFNLTG